MTNACPGGPVPHVPPLGGTLLGDPVVWGTTSTHRILIYQPQNRATSGASATWVSRCRFVARCDDRMATDPAAASDTPVAQADYPVSMFPDGIGCAAVIIPMNFAEAPHAVRTSTRAELR